MKFTEIVPHISFPHLDLPYFDNVSTKACLIDVLFDRILSDLNFEGVSYAI
jgi:hypothetical protein